MRDKWKFNGYVVSDCGAASDIAVNHHYTQTMAEGMAAAVKAGMDLVCAWPARQIATERDALLKAAQQGLLSKDDMDRAVSRLFTARVKLGMFDPADTGPYSKITIAENDTEPHRQLALKAARETLVLLKNDHNLLPLGNKYKTIAVIGPNADSVDPLVGNYNGTPSHPVTILAGVAQTLLRIKGAVCSRFVTYRPSANGNSRQILACNSGGEGLSAEYFAGAELQGTAVVKRNRSRDRFRLDDGARPETQGRVLCSLDRHFDCANNRRLSDWIYVNGCVSFLA